jgi:hypothetical protein
MARQITLKALLNFNFADQAEFTSMRTRAIAFATANSGTCDIVSSDQPMDVSTPYYGRLKMEFEGLTRAQAAGLMTTIDSELDDLPELIVTNGAALKYNFEEIEDGIEE